MPSSGESRHLIEGRADLSGGPVAVEPRCAWLLQVTRLAHDPRLDHADFSRALQEAGAPIDPRRLAAVESGKALPDPRTALAVDTVVGSSGPRVAAAVAYLGASPVRSGRPARDTPLERLQVGPFDAALERLLAGAGTGPDWFNVLSDERTRADGALPADGWSALVVQLFNELSRAVGPAQAFRKRALAQLIRNGRTPVFRAFRGFLHEGTCQALAYAALTLAYGTGRDYNGLAIETLGHPDTGASWGALHATAAKLSLGHFRRADVARIEAQALPIIERGLLHDGVEALFRALPGDSRQRISRASSHGAKLLATERVLQPLDSEWAALGPSLARQAEARLDAEALQGDTMLEALVTEGLLHPHFEGREAARVALASSPYREALGHASLAVVRQLPPAQQAVLGEFLVFMVDESHLEGLAALTAPDLPMLLRHYAFLALARIRGPLPSAVRANLHAALQKPTDLATRGAVFALGMHGQFEEEYGSIVLIEDPMVVNCWQHQGRAIFE